jgi:hypothetical protein
MLLIGSNNTQQPQNNGNITYFSSSSFLFFSIKNLRYYHPRMGVDIVVRCMMRRRGSTILRSKLIKPPLGLHGGSDMMMRPTRARQGTPSHH